MYKPMLKGHEEIGDTRAFFPALAAEVAGVLLLVIGIAMVLSLVMIPFGIIAAVAGVLILARRARNIRRQSTP